MWECQFFRLNRGEKMIIERILNNNAVIAKNKAGEEIFVKGKGIAFQQKTGAEIDESRIEKIFVLENKEANRKYQDLLIEIPNDVIEVTQTIIDFIKESLSKELSDNIYITLTDHISNLLQRVSLGIQFDNTLLWDIRRMYKSEYLIGEGVIKMIQKSFDVKIPSDEANFIALHIVNAEMNTDMTQVYDITESINYIVRLIEKFLELSIDRDGIAFSRFILHLRFFFERVFNAELHSSEDANEEVLEFMIVKYPDIALTVNEIIRYTDEQYHVNAQSERLYLFMHILKLAEN
jgi:beta-glucoside operon transcriptional antiterminator